MSVAVAAADADPALALVSAKTYLDGVSGDLRDRMPEGSPCTIGRRRKVHAVVLIPWLGNVKVPAPACHVGVSGYRLDRLQPADLTKPGAIYELCARPACRALHEAAHRAAPRSITDAVPLTDGWVQDPLPLMAGVPA